MVLRLAARRLHARRRLKAAVERELNIEAVRSKSHGRLHIRLGELSSLLHRACHGYAQTTRCVENSRLALSDPWMRSDSNLSVTKDKFVVFDVFRYFLRPLADPSLPDILYSMLPRP